LSRVAIIIGLFDFSPGRALHLYRILKSLNHHSIILTNRGIYVEQLSKPSTDIVTINLRWINYSNVLGRLLFYVFFAFLCFLKMFKYISTVRAEQIFIIARLVRNVFYSGLSDAHSGFRAYSWRAINLITPSEQGMGASTEILLKAEEFGLKIVELPIKVSYAVEKLSTHNPILHGLDVVLSTMKHLSIRRPFLRRSQCDGSSSWCEPYRYSHPRGKWSPT